MKYRNLFTEGRIGRLRIKNRVVMASMDTCLSSDTEGITSKLIDHYAARAKGGVGLIIVEGCAVVDAHLGGLWRIIRLDNDKYIAGHYELVEAVHLNGAKIMLQLHHPGRLATLEATEKRQPVAPSPIMVETPEFITVGMTIPRELTVPEIKELAEYYALAALRAKIVAYDGVEVHGGHGYLLHQFLSPRTNKRADNYGGSLENRMRFPLEVIKRIKEKCGNDFPILFRLSAEETCEGGYKIEDSKLMAQYLEKAGVDALDITTGGIEDKDGISRNVDPMSYPQGWRVALSEQIKQQVKVPIITVGVIRDPQFAEGVLAEDKADFIAIGRGLLADSDWANKALKGQPDDIRKCVSCNYCALSFMKKTPIRCAVNAEVGRDKEFMLLTPSIKAKKIMVVGSGPAGMESARVASLRGHRVMLYERMEKLGGGQLSLCSIPPHKEKMKWVLEFLSAQIHKMDIDVKLNTEVTPDIVRSVRPDVLIIATGATPFLPDLSGVDKLNVLSAHDVLREELKMVEQRVAVLGGFSLGCETAEFLAEKGNTVHLISRSAGRKLARGMHLSNRIDLMVRLRQHQNVFFLTEHDVKMITDSGVIVIDKMWRERTIEVDYVVLARGVRSVDKLSDELKGEIEEIYVIGDASKPRDIASAILEGATISRAI